MATITRQDLVRSMTTLLKSRGLRLAAHSSASDAAITNSDSYKVYTHVSGNLAAPAGTVYRIVVDFTLAELAILDERVVENLGGPTGIPTPTRV